MVSIMDYGITSTTQHQQDQQHQQHEQEEQQEQQQQYENNDSKRSCSTTTTTNCDRPKPPKSAISQNSIELDLSTSPASNVCNNKTIDTELTKRTLKLNLTEQTCNIQNDNIVDQFSNIKSPKSPLVSTIRHSSLAHQTTLTSQVDLVEDRKTLRDALYQGIFHRHRRTIFALGSFLRMLKSRNSQYNTIRSSSEGEDIDEVR